MEIWNFMVFANTLVVAQKNWEITNKCKMFLFCVLVSSKVFWLFFLTRHCISLCLTEYLLLILFLLHSCKAIQYYNHTKRVPKDYASLGLTMIFAATKRMKEFLKSTQLKWITWNFKCLVIKKNIKYKIYQVTKGISFV